MDLTGTSLLEYLSGPYLRSLQGLEPITRERELQMTRMIIHQVTCGLYQGQNLTIREAMEQAIRPNVQQAGFNPTLALALSLNPLHGNEPCSMTRNPKKRSDPHDLGSGCKRRK